MSDKNIVVYCWKINTFIIILSISFSELILYLANRF